MRKPIIIGQAPSRNGDAHHPCEGKIRERLAFLMGLSESEYMEKFERANLINWFPGRLAKGDKFPMRIARICARDMLLRLEHRRALLLGKKVAEAFGVKVGFLEWAGSFLVVPHPSGINRWWNDPKNVERAHSVLSEL